MYRVSLCSIEAAQVVFMGDNMVSVVHSRRAEDELWRRRVRDEWWCAGSWGRDGRVWGSYIIVKGKSTTPFTEVPTEPFLAFWHCVKEQQIKDTCILFFAELVKSRCASTEIVPVSCSIPL